MINNVDLIKGLVKGISTKVKDYWIVLAFLYKNPEKDQSWMRLDSL